MSPVCTTLEGHYPDKSRLLYDLSHAELRNGNWADAIGHKLQAIASIPRGHRGRIIVWNNALARLYAASGDIERADQVLAKVEGLLDEARQWRGWGRHGPHWRATFFYVPIRLRQVVRPGVASRGSTGGM